MAKGSLLSNLSLTWSQNLTKKQYDEVMKRLVKRLSREGLLGNKMKDFPDYWRFRNIKMDRM